MVLVVAHAGLPLMSVETRFQQPLPKLKYLPFSLPTIDTGSYTSPTLPFEEWLDVENDIKIDIDWWLASQAKDKVYVPPLPHKRSASSEAGVWTALGQQLDVIQQALDQSCMGAEWLQGWSKGCHGNAHSPAASSTAHQRGVGSEPDPARISRGNDLLHERAFELVQGGVCKTFIEVKEP